jgi:Arc/MetJ-type ribon-helix-helix transcriptional regulator
MATITFRVDEKTEKALSELTAEGAEKSEAIRQAIVDQARQRRRERMLAESQAAANDPDDVAEMRAVMADMDRVRAW